ncbi:unnamed protein product [Caenorhabditis bovis]|uniref:RRM domain-containing protein n=1 Tax=Caenorhabditis bovis TaxID=2654633 RepID=A0A8S1ENH3_9PELO|nr:unnamed protein product [Caenorhabditis bovis]
MAEKFKAFVGNLPLDCITSDIETIIQFLGWDESTTKQCEIFMVHDKESGRFKGFAYVSFPTEELLLTAIENLNGVNFVNRPLKVNRALPREHGRGGRGGGRGGRGGSFGGRRNDNHNEGHGGHHGGSNGGRRPRNRVRSRRSETEQTETAAPAPPSERPRLNLKPRSTNPEEIAALKKKEEEELAKRMEKLFN